MRALRYHLDEGILKTEDVEDPPQPRGDDVLIRVKATAISHGELASLRTGEKVLRIPGHDVAGIIEVVGDEVSGFAPGDEVFALLPCTQTGAASTHTLASADDIAIKPPRLTWEETVSIPSSALTVYQALFTHAVVRPGQKVLVVGTDSIVGSMTVQIARAARCLVSAVCCTEQVELVKALGAHEVFDHSETPLSVLSHHYDVVIDCIGSDVLPQCFALLRGKGKLICTARPATGEEKAQRPDVEAIHVVVEPDGEELTRIAQCVEQEIIRPVVGRMVSLEEGAAVLEMLDEGRAGGKIVVSIDDGRRVDSPRQSGVEM